MRRRPSSAASLLLLALLAPSCRHVAPLPTPLPADWSALIDRSVPFAGLYRLTCCGHGTLLATVRSGEGRLLLSVVAPPGTKVSDVWVSDEGTTVRWPSRPCRAVFAAGSVPIDDKVSLPIDADLVGLLLAGHLPDGAEPLLDRPGRVAAMRGPDRLEARIEGLPTRCTGLRLFREGQANVELEATLSEHHGPLPGRIAITAGTTRVLLELVSWQGSESPAPPAWLTLPKCRSDA